MRLERRGSPTATETKQKKKESLVYYIRNAKMTADIYLCIHKSTHTNPYIHAYLIYTHMYIYTWINIYTRV